MLTIVLLGKLVLLSLTVYAIHPSADTKSVDNAKLEVCRWAIDCIRVVFFPFSVFISLSNYLSPAYLRSE